MTTTTLKLPDDLRQRIAEQARNAGVSPHAFMLEAIARHTALAERRRDFVGAALAAEEDVAQYGLVHDGDEVLAWLGQRLAGRPASRPRKRRL